MKVKDLFENSDIHYGQGMESALDEAAYLVSFVAGLPPDFSEQHHSHRLTAQQVQLILSHVQTRVLERKPLAYILGQTWYHGYPFIVNSRTLIPRSPIGELIENQFYPWIQPERVDKVLDLCSGNGCLGILVAHSLPDVQVDLTDVDEECLGTARANIELNRLESRVRLYRSDVFDQLPRERYDIIVCNPPYVPFSEQEILPAEFHHEPVQALYAGADGLDVVHRVLEQAAEYLTSNGILVLEVGQAAEALENAYPEHMFLWAEFEYGGEGVCVLDYRDCCTLARQKQ